MPNHHPDESLLIEYAAGSLSEAKALLVATHLTLCPACRKAVEDGEIIGGALLQTSTTTVDAGDPTEPADAPKPSGARGVKMSSGPLPSPLRDYVGVPFAEIKWKRMWLG